MTIFSVHEERSKRITLGADEFYLQDGRIEFRTRFRGRPITMFPGLWREQQDTTPGTYPSA
jgi:hypothetical protein